MNIKRLASWLIMVSMITNLNLQAAHVALAAPAKQSEIVKVGELISVNKASSEELQQVNGIGPALAERIISYRDANGGFKSIDDLKQVKGIGDLKYEKIKSQVTM